MWILRKTCKSPIILMTADEAKELCKDCSILAPKLSIYVYIYICMCVCILMYVCMYIVIGFRYWMYYRHNQLVLVLWWTYASSLNLAFRIQPLLAHIVYLNIYLTSCTKCYFYIRQRISCLSLTVKMRDCCVNFHSKEWTIVI